ncbi:MAG: peptide chain release factor N(5)-glutamine methyltransferase [Firmicutes bacterium]|nr:peptide chain release factor N(5)-glutamine methyltransferase [Bacillota bacterium]
MNKEINKSKTQSTPQPIGGQALMEGVMMRGKNSMAMCVRDPNGKLQVQTKRIKSGKSIWHRIFVIRGILKFGQSLYAGTVTLAESAKVSFPEDDKKSSKATTGIMIFVAMLLGLVLAVGLFFLLPSFLTDLVIRFGGVTNQLVLSLIEGGIRMSIFLTYLLIVTVFKDIRRTFMYHGAEHKAINCLEKDLPLTLENVQACSTRHNRCGTTFLFFVMVVSILVFSLATWLISLISGVGDWINNWAFRAVIRLALLPFVAGLSYELLRLIAKTPDNWFFFIFKAPGLALQRLTTRKPDDGMCDVAICALEAVLAMEADPDRVELLFGEAFVRDERSKLSTDLQSAGITEAKEVDWIMRIVLGKGERDAVKLTKAQKDRLDQIVARRITREPLDLIVGYSYFYGHKVVVNKDVLLPRMETERVAEAVVKQCGVHGAGCSVLDLCTGSGCIALTVAKATDAKVTAVDISEEALQIARTNLADIDVEVIQSDLFGNLEGRKFDIIVTNPPYIASNVIDTLEPEVKDHSPKISLDGGTDGLDFYRQILTEAKNHLTPNGTIIMEIGYDQGSEIKELAEKTGYNNCEITKDYDGNDRVAIIK